MNSIETSNTEKSMEWICRVLMTVCVLMACNGYIAYLQTKWQLTSPLIPESTVHQIILDSHVIEASMAGSLLFLVGLWFYSFKKKTAAVIFFSAAIISSYIIRLYG